MRHLMCLTLPALLALACAGCAGAAGGLTGPGQALLARDLAHTRRAGTGASFRPAAAGLAVRTGSPVGPWRCRARRSVSYGAHIELFADRQGLVVPAGIGVNQPVYERSYVVGGRCLYPLHTTEPTGVVQVDASAGQPQLGELFALWGQPLTATRLGAFSGPVAAYLDGQRWWGNPRGIPLRRHAQIVLELGGFVAPHASYGFPAGL